MNKRLTARLAALAAAIVVFLSAGSTSQAMAGNSWERSPAGGSGHVSGPGNSWQ